MHMTLHQRDDINWHHVMRKDELPSIEGWVYEAIERLEEYINKRKVRLIITASSSNSIKKTWGKTGKQKFKKNLESKIRKKN